MTNEDASPSENTPADRDLSRYVGFRCSDKVWNELAKRASNDRRSVSSYIRNVLEDHVREERNEKS